MIIIANLIPPKTKLCMALSPICNLLKHGTNELMSRIKQAHPVPLENVTTFRDIEDEVTDFVRNGFKRGFTIGLHNFDKIFSTYTKQFKIGRAHV